MSYDILLFRKNKTNISKSKLEDMLWRLHWIYKTGEENVYHFRHDEDQCFIEISHETEEIDDFLGRNKKIDSVRLRTWALSSEWSINHLIRLSFQLAERLNLVIYDEQEGRIITKRNIERMINGYSKWRISCKALKFRLDKDIDPNKLLPITVFVACSFAKEDDYINDYIIHSLRNCVKKVLTGHPYQPSTIIRKVRSLIRKSDVLVAILTRRKKISRNKYKSSEWVQIEATYALKIKKRVILIKEDGVEDIFSFPSGYEYIPYKKYDVASIQQKLGQYLSKKKGH